MLHELRAMNVPPQQVLELHTELESCELPGAYCARMIRESWPQARITSIASYGPTMRADSRAWPNCSLTRASCTRSRTVRRGPGRCGRR